MRIQKYRHKTLTGKFIPIVIFLIITGAVASGEYLFFESQTVELNKKMDATAHEIAVKSAEFTKEAKKKLPVYISLPGSKSIRAIVQDYSQSSSIWAIVSKSHPISVDYVPDGLKIPNVPTRTDKSDMERSVRSDIEKPLIDMFSAATAAGNNLMIGSGYRSATQQKIYFDSSANAIGVEATNQAIAYPGQSEHQTGLAADISTVSRNCYLDDCFGTTADGQWLLSNSYKFGFILRYPAGKETITGYQYEPWHFRYVGIDLATALHESGMTLDEAWPYLIKANATLRENGAI